MLHTGACLAYPILLRVYHESRAFYLCVAQLRGSFVCLRRWGAGVTEAQSSSSISTATTLDGRISSIPSVRLGQFADGATKERFTDSQQQLFVGLVNNDNLLKILKGKNYTVVGTPETGTSNGVSYQKISARQKTDGADLTIYVNGLYLTNNETASVVLVDSETYGTAILAAGDPPLQRFHHSLSRIRGTHQS